MTTGTTGPAAATATDSVLACRDVVKEFHVAGSKVVAVDRVSLDFPAGNVLAVVGESGSGKSTLARMLLRLMPVTSGTISFRGQDVTNLRGKQLRSYWSEVQAVFQDPFASFNQFFPVGGLLRRSLALASVGRDEADALIEECLGYVGSPRPTRCTSTRTSCRVVSGSASCWLVRS